MKCISTELKNFPCEHFIPLSYWCHVRMYRKNLSGKKSSHIQHDTLKKSTMFKFGALNEVCFGVLGGITYHIQYNGCRNWFNFGYLFWGCVQAPQSLFSCICMMAASIWLITGVCWSMVMGACFTATFHFLVLQYFLYLVAAETKKLKLHMKIKGRLKKKKNLICSKIRPTH